MNYKIFFFIILTLFSFKIQAESINAENIKEQMSYIGDRKVTKITSCSYENGPVSNSGNNCYFEWTASHCTNGVPSGTCFSVIRKAVHGGSDEDWGSNNPGDSNTLSNFPNGGMTWWNSNGCSNLYLKIGAVYFCEETP